MRSPRARIAAVAFVVVAAGIVAARARRPPLVRCSAECAAPAADRAACAIPPEPRPPPKRVWRQSTRYPIVTGDPKEAFWQMHENAPLVDPDDEPRPTTILLHGMCADSDWTCDWLQYFDLAPQWMLCPRAPARCDAGYRWSSAPDTLRAIQATIASAKSRHGDRLRDDDLVLAGMSQGAYAIASLLRWLAKQPASPLHLRGVVMQGAEVRVDPADALKLGVRVALTAGDRDGAAPAMRAEAERLRRAGVDARWESMGRDEGHFSSVSTGKTMAILVDWARAR